MIKLMLFVKRRAGTTPEQFQDYYETRHVPLALATLRHVARYQRNYIVRPFGWEPDFDCVVELWIGLDLPWDEARLLMSDAAGQRVLAADEEKFLDRSSTRVTIVAER